MNDKMKMQRGVNNIKDVIVGYKYRHFKGGIYMVTDIAVDSESGEPMVIYRNVVNKELVWCRPANTFMSKVDHEKYPDAKQELRFERIGWRRMTNADRIRNMSDEGLADWLLNMDNFIKDDEPYMSIYNLETEKEEEIHDSYGDLLIWLQSEAE